LAKIARCSHVRTTAIRILVGVNATIGPEHAYVHRPVSVCHAARRISRAARRIAITMECATRRLAAASVHQDLIPPRLAVIDSVLRCVASMVDAIRRRRNVIVKQITLVWPAIAESTIAMEPIAITDHVIPF
jgi:hypothetical protein